MPDYLGSKSTFTLGQFGGHAGRALMTGDVLHITASHKHTRTSLLRRLIPVYTASWVIGVLYGPHGAPDFFTESDIQNFLKQPGRFTTTLAVPGSGYWAQGRTGLGPMGVRPVFTHPIFTIMPTPSAQLISPAICR